jgi:hypothetical protein
MKQVKTEDPQVLGATVQNFVATATWRPGFVHPCTKFTSVRGRFLKLLVVYSIV